MKKTIWNFFESTILITSKLYKEIKALYKSTKFLRKVFWKIAILIAPKLYIETESQK
jgi:hypothetical protein